MQPPRSLIKRLLLTEPDGREIRISGWLRTRRDSRGGFSFLELSDGSTIKTMQVVADSSLANYESEISRATTGSSLTVIGALEPSEGKGQTMEVRAAEVVIHSRADENYPLQKKRHSFEFLREIAHLRPRTNTIGAVMRLRNTLSLAIHRFFQSRDFFYINTPIISSGDCEGAGELFQVTGFNLDSLPQKEGRTDFARDFFGRPAYLTVSGQLQAEACALALSNVYTFGPTFRAENSNTSRHLAEFWMVEPEMAFCELQQDADLAEEFLKEVIKEALENSRDDLEFFNKHIDDSCLQRLENVIANDFERLTYSEAIEILKKAETEFEFPVEWGRDLQSEHERYLTERVLKKPVIVTDYPKEIKAFYMYLNDDGTTVRAMDVLLPGIGEIIGGSEREQRIDVLSRRIEELRMDPADYGWYLDLRRYGGAPHSGFGLGFERLVQYLSGMENIRDVIPFPRTPGHAAF